MENQKIALTSDYFVLIALKDDIRDTSHYYIQFPKIVLSSFSEYYNSLFEDFKDADHEFVNLTKEELELFEAISYSYYKTYIDTDADLMISLGYKIVIPHLDNMNMFFQKIYPKKLEDDDENSLKYKLKNIICDLFKNVEPTFKDKTNIHYIVYGMKDFVEKNFFTKISIEQ